MNGSIGIIGGAEDAAAAAITGSLVGVFVIVYFLMLLVAFAFGIASYVLQSLGVYTIAQRRGLKHAWAAWVPIANLWLLGSVSDQYQYVAKGKIKNRRKVLLALSIAAVVVYIGWLISMIGSAFSGAVGGMLAGMILGWLALMAIMITVCVFQYIALYDLYQSCQPNNAVLFLVLSILVSATMPFFIFFSRKKDLGMPPRKQPVEEQIVEETPTEEAEEIAEEIAEEPAEETVDETVEEIVEASTEEAVDE